MDRVAVLGAGSWGTALSLLLANKGCAVSLWVWDPAQAATMLETRENPFFPGFSLPRNISITTSIPEALLDADFVILATISSAVKDVIGQARASIPKGAPIISATKGLDGDTGLTISQIVKSILGGGNPVAALSGPNLAVEVAKGVPTATVVACSAKSVARRAQSLLICPGLRVYTSGDVVGVELAGALKNVIAIAAGISDGLGFGDNTKAALLSRGLAEISRLGVKIGAKRSTFLGLAGVGDLIATCASPLSRNHRVGIGLGQGRKLDEVVREIGHVAEGVPTAEAAYRLAQKHGVYMPITEQVYLVLFQERQPREVVEALLKREPRDELD